MIRDRFLAHQRTDKGFGPALGPDAPRHLTERLEGMGHKVAIEPSDWELGLADRALLEAMLESVVAVAGEIRQDARLADWAAQRRMQLARGELGLTVGHLDLLALPEAA
jgi:hypothetical protein